jgi:hypothetical protein
MSSVTPLSVELGPPRAWRAVILCACIAAIAGSAVAFASMGLVGTLAAVCIGVAVIAWRGAGRWSGVRLVFDAGGGLELRLRDGTNRKVELDHAIHIGPLLVIVVRRRDGKRDDVAVWRDQLDADGWRRLKVRVDRRHVSRQNTDSAG